MPAEAEPVATDADSKRRGQLYKVFAGAVLLVAVGWVGASLIKSPAQQAADTGAPEPSVITAPIERTIVAETVVTRGEVRTTQTLSAIPQGSPKGTERAIISKLTVKQGETLKPGVVLVEVSGRPVFLLQGAVPAYRSLSPGMSGPDVAQLQKALKQVGHSSAPDAAGEYGRGTASAVAALYKSAGYTPVGGAANASLPSGEVVFAIGFPVIVSEMAASVGDAAEAANISVSFGDLAVRTQVDSRTAQLLRPGQEVEITSEILGKSVDGKVVSTNSSEPASAADEAGMKPDGETGDEPDTGSGAENPEASSGSSAVEQQTILIEPVDSLPASWAGQDVRVTITSASSKEKVLAVPVTAISMGADGKAFVVVSEDSDSSTQRKVPVKLGVTGSGLVQVTALEGRIEEGQRVIVGLSARSNE